MDDGMKTCAVLTMAYEDYLFLERFVDYYTRQIGRENIYILSHGNDPRHREIAAGANVIAIPRDPHLDGFDRRRWTALSMFASGLSQFYRWVLTTDVDEMVLLDPEAGDTLASYLDTAYPDMATAPVSVAPFALELIHKPELEPEPIEPGVPILSRRRIYRPSPNYSKPCLTRGIVRFTPGGHANTLGPRTLSDDLYLLHLRFFDREYITARLNLRADQVMAMDWIPEDSRKAHGWMRSLDEYLDACNWRMRGEDIRLEPMREQMRRQRQRPNTNIFGWGNCRNDKLYRIPERFAGLV